MTDKTTKLLLLLIALGLWANALVPVFRPITAKAFDIDDIQRFVGSMESDLGSIARGTCTNGKIC